jgi:hypothetical protein
MHIGYPSGKPQECRFVKSDGRRGHAVAVRGMAYCYFHLPAHLRRSAKGRPEKPIRLNFLPGDSARSRAQAISQLETAMAQGRLDHFRGNLCIFALSNPAMTMSPYPAEAAPSAPASPKDLEGNL